MRIYQEPQYLYRLQYIQFYNRAKPQEDKANKVTSISGSSTDTEYPSAKAVNTELNKKQTKTLTETIIVEGATETTVEGALTAINNNRVNKSLSNLNENGENHFANPNLSNVTGTSGFRKLVEVYNNGTSWYKVFDLDDISSLKHDIKTTDTYYLVVNFPQSAQSTITYAGQIESVEVKIDAKQVI